MNCGMKLVIIAHENCKEKGIIMNKNFGDWYRTVNIEPNSIQLGNRWNGIESYLKVLGTDSSAAVEIFELIRLFYNLPVSQEFREKFVDIFTNIDSAFNRKNQLELSVLAGATLIEMVEQDYLLSDLVMLATTSMHFQDRSPAVPNIFQNLLDLLNKRTASIRENISIPTKKNIVIPSNKAILTTVTSEGAEWSEDFRKALSNYITSLGTYITKTNNIHEENLKYIKVDGWRME
jgi:hypothetical protein